MSQLVGFLILVALLLVGSLGWGELVVIALRRAGWEGAETAFPLGLRAAIGVALFLGISGWLIAMSVGDFDLFIAWHLIGCVILFGRRFRTFRQDDVVWWGSGWLRASFVAIPASIFIAVVSLGNAMGRPTFNVNDDDAAYIYLAVRLLKTGALIDPFNQRRIASLGGQVAYQSMFVHVSGYSSPQGFEMMFSSLLLVLLIVTGRRRNPWMVLAGSLLSLAVLVGRSVGPIVNLSPKFSAAVLTLAMYQVLSMARFSHTAERRGAFALTGMFLAGLLALRFTFAIPAVIAGAAVCVALTRRRQTVESFVLAGMSTLICLGGWSVSSYISSGTPLFPLIAGNYNTDWPGNHDPSADLQVYWSLAKGTLERGDTGLTFLFIALLILMVAWFRRGREQTLVVLGAALVGTVIELTVFVYELSGSTVADLWRFLAPSTLACGLLAIELLWPKSPSWSSVRTYRHIPQHRPSNARRALRARTPKRTAPAMAIILIAVLLCGSSPSGYLRDIRRATDGAVSTLVDPTSHFVNRYRPIESEYDQLNHAVPRGAKVFAAVSFPALLQFNRFQFATLDIPGSTSPSPHMPFFRGVTPVLRYLSIHGFTYIVADLPSAPGLYQRAQWEEDRRSPVWQYREWAPWVLDWLKTVGQLAHSPHARRYGNMIVIPIQV